MLLRLAKPVLILPVRNLTKKPKSIITNLNYFKSGKSDGPPFTHFVQIGDPVLKEKSQSVPIEEIKSDAVQNIIQTMVYTLERYDGIGISAPQIGVPLQIIAVQFTKSQLEAWSDKMQQERKMEVIPLQIFINPKISVLDNSQITQREGCCSLHGMSCRISRSSSIKLNALDHNGDPVEVKAKNWTARTIQHEVDHLHGTLITDKMEPGSLVNEYWNVINRRHGDFKLSYQGIKEGPRKWFSSSKFWRASD